MNGITKMIEFVKGDLLKAEADALVNTVNCVGVMGKGIALQFKMAFPENFKQYYKACQSKKVRIGRMFVTKQLFRPRYIINFPTKKHWKEKSKLEYISQGLTDLKEEIKNLKIKSIAIPPLGAGLGGLNWPDVKKLIVKELSQTDDVKIILYEPAGSPAPEEIQIRSEKPKMTNGRAILISLLEQYREPGYKLTLLEIQKLMYFVQEAGESLRLKYNKEKYGPYAPNLEHVLQKIEGHFIRGYGDRTRDSSIRLLEEGLESSKEFLKDKPQALDRLKKVASIIRGFETPYGLELLSTVHWTVKHENKREEDEIIKVIQAWNKRKRNLFLPVHIRKAIKHLKNHEVL
jgi:O-acetyl-ADP-ribose deacetylase (regulator of RNase III)